MKKWMWYALCALSFTANADFFSGNDLYQLYRGHLRADSPSSSGKDYADSMEYLGYVTGVWDAYNGIFICTGEPITRGQVADMIGYHLRDNPELRSKSASSVILVYLEEKYPCKKS